MMKMFRTDFVLSDLPYSVIRRMVDPSQSQFLLSVVCIRQETCKMFEIGQTCQSVVTKLNPMKFKGLPVILLFNYECQFI